MIFLIPNIFSATATVIEHVSQTLKDVKLRMDSIDDRIERAGNMFESVEGTLMPQIEVLLSEVSELREQLRNFGHDGCPRQNISDFFAEAVENTVNVTDIVNEPNRIAKVLNGARQLYHDIVNTWWFKASLVAAFLTIAILMGVVFALLCAKQRASRFLRNFSEQLAPEVELDSRV